MTVTKAELRRFVENNRHATRLTRNLQAPQNPLRGPAFLRTYKRQFDRMQDFIREAVAARHQLEAVVNATGQILANAAFRALLQAHDLGTLPWILTQVSHTGPDSRSEEQHGPSCFTAEPQLVGGVCLEALDLLNDFGAPLKIFPLLREVVPSRQVEIVRLMLALDRVQFRVARVLIALTPRSQLTDPFAPRKQYEGISPTQLADMQTDLAKVSHEYLSAANTHGATVLNLIAVTGYIDRLLNNPALVRFMARNFAGHLEVYQELLDFRESRFQKRTPTV
ncbi:MULTISPECIES: plasmid partitioning protein RepB C-terminal domain-containing protein [unclassified Mesorhizobium]|uniref:plasmid partitioning protein RepB C-terminal domain-containing protein n=1 Tax=unclassified Mesorhizobium TaxID=325217 RepID=UPI0024157089|nr:MULTISPECIES: plasmid partitioning protein RepB C-terminal domain-containing protein [unclassified Mesorhizobium]MDG4854561.1 plasmid partitioning protein RepB C-terminal domain-containing protein [Mesorhizobium sp. WSM4982]MDG4916116.1 plasmid partitioning protein RepB C-terminal domain-containing protein [Mesorhizobium sp. WSM4983]